MDHPAVLLFAETDETVTRWRVTGAEAAGRDAMPALNVAHWAA